MVWRYLLIYYNFLFQDWDRASTPLVAKGTDVKFPGKPCEKISGNEGQTIYIQLDVEGDPPPKVEWFKVNLRKLNKLEQILLEKKDTYITIKLDVCIFFIILHRASKTLLWNLGLRDGQMVPLDKLLWVLRTSSKKMKALTNVFSMAKLSTNSAFMLQVMRYLNKVMFKLTHLNTS